MVVRIRLLDPEMLGRRFQYAFLSFADLEKVDVKPDIGEAVFLDEKEYVKTVKMVLDAIIETLSWPENAEGNREKSKCLDHKINCHGAINCTSLDRGPNFYQAGGKSEKSMLKAAGLTKCKYYYYDSKKKECVESIGWVHAAVSYACKVIEKGGPLGGEAKYNVPRLAMASLFSVNKIRNIIDFANSDGKMINVDTLGTVLLGGALSYLGKYTLKSGSDDKKTLEFYIIPDYVSRSYRALRQITALGGVKENLARKAINTAENLGVGFEQALALVTASLVLKHVAEARRTGVDIDNVLASGKLYTIQPEKRPQVRAGVPLPNVLLKAYSPETLEVLDWFVSKALYAVGDIGSQVRSAAATCVNNLFLQAVSLGAGELYIKDCMRVLVVLLDEEELPSDVRRAAKTLLWRLEREAIRILSWGVGVL